MIVIAYIKCLIICVRWAFHISDSLSHNLTARRIMKRCIKPGIGCPSCASRDSDHGDLYNELHPFIWVLNALAIWPVDREFPKRTWCKARNPAVVMIALYLATSIPAVVVIQCMIYRLIYIPTDFTDQVMRVLHISIVGSLLVRPLVHWRAGLKMAEYFNQWSKIQISWPKATGEPLCVRCWPRSLGRTLGTTAIGLVMVLTELQLAPDMRNWMVVTHWSSVLFYMFQFNMWDMLSSELRLASQQLNESLRAKLTLGANANQVREHRYLWVCLSWQARLLGLAWGTQMLQWLLAMSVLTMMSAFGLVISAATLNYKRVGTCSIVLAVGLSRISSLCNQSHKTTAQATKVMTKVLLQAKTNQLDNECIQEIREFLTLLQSKALDINLSGFIVINNKTFVNIASAIMTYNVVLAQLAIQFSA